MLHRQSNDALDEAPLTDRRLRLSPLDSSASSLSPRPLARSASPATCFEQLLVAELEATRRPWRVKRTPVNVNVTTEDPGQIKQSLAKLSGLPEFVSIRGSMTHKPFWSCPPHRSSGEADLVERVHA